MIWLILWQYYAHLVDTVWVVLGVLCIIFLAEFATIHL